MTRSLRSACCLLPLLLAACAMHERPSKDELGQRVRVRVAGREIPSILTHNYFVFFALIGPDGARVPIRIRAPETGGCEGLSLICASAIERRCGLEDLDLVPSLHGDDKTQVADLVLPAGYALDFSPGSYFVYRLGEDRRMTSDPTPELLLGQITSDGARYVELTPSVGPELPIRERPPGFARQ